MLDATDLEGGAGDIEVVRVLRNGSEIGRHVEGSSDLKGESELHRKPCKFKIQLQFIMMI